MKTAICFPPKYHGGEKVLRKLEDVKLEIGDLSDLSYEECSNEILIKGCIKEGERQQGNINGNITCIHSDKFQLFLSEAVKSSTHETVIVQVDSPKNHFITLHCNFAKKYAILMDSFQCANGLEMYPKIQEKLAHLKIFQIPVAIQIELDDGFFHAFFNSLTIEWSKYLNHSVKKFSSKISMFHGFLNKTLTRIKRLTDQDMNSKFKRIVIEQSSITGISLDEIKKSVKKLCKIPRDSEVFIELQYAKRVAKNFLKDLENSFENGSLSSSSLWSGVETISKIKDLKEPFDTVRNYEQLQECVKYLDFKSKLYFLKSVRTLCDRHSTAFSDIKIENEFLDALKMEMIKIAFSMPSASTELRKILNVLTVLEKSNCKNLLEKISQTKDVTLIELKLVKSALILLECRTASFSKFLAKLIRQFYEKVSFCFVSENCVDIFRCKGTFVDLETIKQEIIAKGHLIDNCLQIEILAELCFFVNCSVEWKGKNVIIVTDTIIIKDKNTNRYVLDVSGRDGPPHTNKIAKNGSKGDIDGLAGEPGFHGESGGNVQIIANVIKNADNISVISNGGNGSKGQDGGTGIDGIDGKDGKGISEKEFDERFPDFVHFLGGMVSSDIQAFQTKNVFTTKMEEMPLGWFSDKYFDLSDCYLRGVTNDNYVIECGLWTSRNPVKAFTGLLGITNARQSYCFCSGQSGTFGTQGGNGGKGGAGGKGGFHGKIDIKNWKGENKFEIDTTCGFGKCGSDGKNGKGGKGGKNGKQGIDRAHFCYSLLYSTRKLSGHLKIVSYKEPTSTTVYCPKREQYIDVERRQSEYLTRFRDGQNGQNEKTDNNKTTEIYRRINAPILFDIIKEKVQDVFCVKDESKTFDDNIESNYAIVNKFSSKLSTNHTRKAIRDSRENYYGINIPNKKLTSIVNAKKSYQCSNKSKTAVENPIGVRSVSMMNKESVLREEDRRAVFYSEVKIRQLFDKLFQEEQYCRFVENETFVEENDVVTQNKWKNQCFEIPSKDVLGGISHNKIMIHFKFYLLEKADKLCCFQKEETMKLNYPSSKAIMDHLQIRLNSFFQHLIWDVLASHDVHCLKSIGVDLETQLHNIMQEILIQGGINIWSRDDVASHDYEDTTKYRDIDDEFDCYFTNTFDKKRVEHKENVLRTYKLEVGEESERNLSALLEWAKHNIKRDEICCIIQKLRHVKYDNTPLLIKCLKLRLVDQCCHIAEEFLLWFFMSFLEKEECIVNGKYLRIVATINPKNWIFEWILQELMCHSDFNDDMICRELLSKIRENKINLFLCRYLSKLGKGEKMSNHMVKVMIETLQTLTFDVEESFLIVLETTNVFEWQHEIKCHKNMTALKSFAWKDDSNLLDAAYYSNQIINRNGQKFIDAMYECVKKFEIDQGIFLSALRRLCIGSLSISMEDLSIVKSKTKAKSMFENHSDCNGEKTASGILLDMKTDSNSTIVAKEVDKIEKTLNEIYKKGSMPSKCFSYESNEDGHTSKSAAKVIKDFTEDDIRVWSNVCKQTLKSNPKLFSELFPEIMAVIEVAINLKRGFELRNPQKISIIAFIYALYDSNKGILQQISTGEGKTIIIVVLSILESLRGEYVDVITSSSVLAKRDSSSNKDVFDLFQISVSNNCSEDKHDRQYAYSSLVVYGEIGTFQRDILLTEFYNENIIGGRNRLNVIVDEVDSMLLDRGETVLYLSHEIAGIDAIEFVYTYIWSLVNSKGMIGTDADRYTVRRCMLDVMFGLIYMEYISMFFPSEFVLNVNDVWNFLQKQKIIDHEGRLLTRSFSDFEKLEKISSTCDKVTIGYIINMLKDTVKKGILVEVPNFLQSFINRHLDKWISNAFNAKYMQEGKHFIIDVDRSDAGRGRDVNIVIMDIDTGTEQYNMQWNSGLHQFLQLKYKCAISLESLKAVFMSNVSFFRLYKKLYGLTGTLGSQKERDLLKDIYEVSYITIPTFRNSRFVELDTILCKTTDDWMTSIHDRATKMSQSRPVLVICETIHLCDEIEKKCWPEKVKVYVYKHTYCESSFLKYEKGLESGCVILATNLAGRGTDIGISDDINEKGGLHVILTYLPSNLRIEEQAFGRAARKGQRGSGELIICEILDDNIQEKECFQISRMKIQRDTSENERISKMQHRYEIFIKEEEQLFRKFQTFNEHLKRKLVLGRTDPEFQNVILQAVLDRWAFWLDSVETSLENSGNVSCITDSLCQFLKEMDDATDNQSSSKIIEMLQSPSHLVKAGKAKVSKTKEFNEAITFFDQVINNDPLFSESALYYKANCLLKNGNYTSAGYDTVRYTLAKCKFLIDQRIEQLRNSVKIVEAISYQYTDTRETYTMSEGYVQQKDNAIQIYHQIINSIYSITGYAIEPVMFVNDTINLFNAYQIFCDLDKKKILSCPKISKFPPDEFVWQSVKETYELYSDEICSKLKELKDNDRVTADDFKGIFPSREELWELLIKQEVLNDQHNCILIHKEQLRISSDTLPTSITDMLESLECSLVDDIKSYIFLYPDQKDSIIADRESIVLRKTFEDNFGTGNIFEVLQRENILSSCLFAKLSPEAEQLLSNKTFNKFDQINDNSFTLIDEKIDTSKAIFEELVAKHIVSRDGKLQKRETLGNIWLPAYGKYATEIRNFVAKYSKYRICATYILHESEFPLDLASNPHNELFRSLTETGIVTPFKVMPKISEKEMTKELQFLYGNSSEPPKILQSEIVDMISSTKKEGLKAELISNKICKLFDDNETLIVIIKKDELKTRDIMKKVCSIDNEIICFISYRLDNHANTSGIVGQLDQWKEGLAELENVDTELRSIADNFSEEQLIDLCYEIVSTTHNGFGEIMVLTERKWTLKSICKMTCILAIGITQIGIAIAIEIFSCGSGIFFANALLSEGVGDIIFAVECMISGHCTLQSYLQHKGLSLSMTILSAGIGALFVRGAKFSKFGHKIGGQFLQNQSGSKIVAKELLAKTAAKRIGKKLFALTTTRLADKAIDFALEKSLRTFFDNICSEVIRKLAATPKIKDELVESLSGLVRNVEKQKADETVKKLMKQSFKYQKSDVAKVLSTVSEISNVFRDGLSEAMEKWEYTGDSRVEFLRKVIVSVKVISKAIDVVNASVEVYTLRDLILKKFKDNIILKSCSHGNVEVDNLQFASNLVDDVINEANSVVERYIESQLENILVKPILQIVGSKVTKKISQGVNKLYRCGINRLHDKDFRKLKAENQFKLQQASSEDENDIKLQYHKRLLDLLKKTRSPDLYADIVEEGTPLGIYSVQAVSEITNTVINITTAEGHAVTIPQTFTPSKSDHESGKSLDITLQFQINPTTGTGCFISQKSKDRESKNYGCLLTAVMEETGRTLERKDIATNIRTDSRIQKIIKQGSHEHFIF